MIQLIADAKVGFEPKYRLNSDEGKIQVQLSAGLDEVSQKKYFVVKLV